MQDITAGPNTAGPSVLVSRRHFLRSTSAVVAGVLLPALAGCTGEPKDTLVPIAGDKAQPGEPLWSPKTNAFVVAIEEIIDTRLIAFANECTYEAGKTGTIGWCRTSNSFVCSSCRASWSPSGEPLALATIGLTRLGVTVSESDDVLVDKSQRIDGSIGVPTERPSDNCVAYFSPP
jgi:hypothetical protein